MTNRTWHRILRAVDDNGGWTGPATQRAMYPMAVQLIRDGHRAKSVGIILAKEYKIRSNRMINDNQ
jgi:hypothetical protein